MHFILYTDKSVNECLKSITERLQIRGTNNRPGLDGWIDKSGTFSISVNAPVVGNIPRRTNLRGKLEKDSGFTVVRGDVPSGARPAGIGLMFGAMGLVALMLLNSGSQLLALAIPVIAAYLFIILRGDDLNSEYLLDELMKMLRAKETPPKAGAVKKPSVTAPAARPAAKPAAKSTPKPAARPTTSSSTSGARPTSAARPSTPPRPSGSASTPSRPSNTSGTRPVGR